MDFFHSGRRIATVNANQEVPVEEPALVPIGKGVAVACNAERSRACNLEHSPVNKAEVRTHQKNRTRFRNVLHAHHLHFVAEYKEECKTECGAQKGHRIVLEVCNKAKCKNHCQNHEAVIKRNRRKDQEQSLTAHDQHEQSHLDCICHGVNTACSIRARKALNHGTQNHEG